MTNTLILIYSMKLTRLWLVLLLTMFLGAITVTEFSNPPPDNSVATFDLNDQFQVAEIQEVNNSIDRGTIVFSTGELTELTYEPSNQSNHRTLIQDETLSTETMTAKVQGRYIGDNCVRC